MQSNLHNHPLLQTHTFTLKPTPSPSTHTHPHLQTHGFTPKPTPSSPTYPHTLNQHPKIHNLHHQSHTYTFKPKSSSSSSHLSPHTNTHLLGISLLIISLVSTSHHTFHHTHTHLLGISLLLISLVSTSHHTLTPTPSYLGFPFSSSPWSPPPITPSHPHPLTWDFPSHHLPGLHLPSHPHTHTHLLGISLLLISLVSTSHHTLTPHTHLLGISLLIISLVSTSHHTLTPTPSYLGFPFSSSPWSPPPITPSHPHPLTWDFPTRHPPGLHLPSHPHTHTLLLGISLLIISLVSTSHHTLTPTPTYLGFPFSSPPWSPPPITPSHPHPLTWDFPSPHLPGLLFPSHPHPLTWDFPSHHLPGLHLPSHPHTHTHLLGISLLLISLVSNPPHTLTPTPTYLGFPFLSSPWSPPPITLTPTYLGFPFSSPPWSPPPITPSHPHPLTWDFPSHHLPGLLLPSHPHTHTHLLGISLFVISLVSSSHHTLEDSSKHSWVDA